MTGGVGLPKSPEGGATEPTALVGAVSMVVETDRPAHAVERGEKAVHRIGGARGRRLHRVEPGGRVGAVAPDLLRVGVAEPDLAPTLGGGHHRAVEPLEPLDGEGDLVVTQTVPPAVDDLAVDGGVEFPHLLGLQD